MSIREAISMIYPGAQQRIGELVVDAIVRESHQFSAQITEHPVEDGSSIADHVYNLPIVLDLDCIISNTPMTLVGLTAFDSWSRTGWGQNNDFAEQAFQKVEKIFADRKPIAILTSLKKYENMVLQSLSIERDGHSAQSLHFRCTAKQISVKQELIKIPIPQSPRAQAKLKKGLQETKALSKTDAIKNGPHLLKWL